MPGSKTGGRRRTGLVAGILAWMIVVCAATAVGLTAVGAVGDGIVGAGQRPLTEAEVQARLRTAGAIPPAPVADGSVRPLASVGPEALASRGGTVLAQCPGGVVEVVSVTPAQGFGVRKPDEDDRDKVEFESDEITVELRLSCADGRPVARESIEDD
jgi:hypothetical protein